MRTVRMESSTPFLRSDIPMENCFKKNPFLTEEEKGNVLQPSMWKFVSVPGRESHCMAEELRTS